MKFFGCAAFAPIKQGKLEPKAKSCIFLGYPHGTKGYQLWSLEPQDQKCFISRDVTLKEELIPWESEHNQANKQPETTSFKIEH